MQHARAQLLQSTRRQLDLLPTFPSTADIIHGLGQDISTQVKGWYTWRNAATKTMKRKSISGDYQVSELQMYY
jgi:hypothetical protein